MPHKSIEEKIHKSESHDAKKIRSLRQSKIKNSMADQLRGEIYTLL